MKLAGVDVGFSKSQRTTGIALLSGEKLRLYRAGTTWEDRCRGLPEGFKPTRLAIDGPIIPVMSHPYVVRRCETFFSKGAFSRRCKPGLSHFGRGYLLRKATVVVFNQFGRHFFKEPVLGHEVVEAFPNLFLGVMVSDKEYRTAPDDIKSKFDWLYDAAAPRLSCLIDFAPVPRSLFVRILEEDDHELRAALICLLTAALAETGEAFICGDHKGGWFWLPPIQVWQPWASNEIHRRLRGFFPVYEDLVGSGC